MVMCLAMDANLFLGNLAVGSWGSGAKGLGYVDKY